MATTTRALVALAVRSVAAKQAHPFTVKAVANHAVRVRALHCVSVAFGKSGGDGDGGSVQSPRGSTPHFGAKKSSPASASHMPHHDEFRKQMEEASGDGGADNMTATKRAADEDYTMPHPIYTPEELHAVKIMHKEPSNFGDKAAFWIMKLARSSFDLLTGYGPNMDEKKYLRRIIFLETVAGVPGMVAGMLRHMKSLRAMQRDHGWIHTLLEEAENERMHLLTFLRVRNPGIMFRSCVLVAQGLVFNAFFLCYLIAPRVCHRFVGYLEEEAVKTYTKCIEDLDDGKLPTWETMPASDIAKGYWHLADDATMRDVLLAVRADEAVHRDVNHTFASMKPDEDNPF